jgi:hypothetical protein
MRHYDTTFFCSQGTQPKAAVNSTTSDGYCLSLDVQEGLQSSVHFFIANRVDLLALQTSFNSAIDTLLSAQDKYADEAASHSVAEASEESL